jgi:ATP-dependent DNA helicase DinG
MRQRAAESDVVIVNHHLLCADASLRRGAYGEVIPHCPTLVVDEAHQLEDIATQYFGVALSSYRIDELVRDGERMVRTAPDEEAMDGVKAAPRKAFGKGAPYGGESVATNTGRGVSASDGAWARPRRGEDIARALFRVSDRARIFFSGLALARGARASAEPRTRYTAEAMEPLLEDGMALAGALEGLEATLALARSSASEGSGADERDEAAAAIQRRTGELRADLRFLLRAADPDFVYFVETRGRSGGLFLRASPIDVSRIVRETLFDRYRAIVLTSATLAVDGSFEYIKGRLGIRTADELRVPSEFDFAHQALLYLPRRMPVPKSPSFAEAAARETIEILKRSRGRAFVLFTSYAVLRTVQQFVEMAVPYPVLVQGTAPRSVLIDQFRRTPNAVLLGTSSFWQGVDVAGDALSCVIVDKLPFASPADPVVAARIDAIAQRGGDAFSEYQVPLAILALQQGLGRLIRHRRDRGVLAILDPRVRTMGYGRRFLASLPPAPVTHGLDAVEQFFM